MAGATCLSEIIQRSVFDRSVVFQAYIIILQTLFMSRTHPLSFKATLFIQRNEFEYADWPCPSRSYNTWSKIYQSYLEQTRNRRNELRRFLMNNNTQSYTRVGTAIMRVLLYCFTRQIIISLHNLVYLSVNLSNIIM